jgi:ATP-dependent protease HslVU (ClpYQ) peptidase subunit
MTILVAVKKHNRIFLGVDSFIANGNTVMPDITHPWKAIKLKHAYLATSGWSLLENIIEHLKVSNHKMMENTFSSRTDVFSFFLELYAELKKNYTLVNFGDENYAQIYNNFVVATSKNIYAVTSNLSVTEHEHYVAKGAGTDFALGSLYATYDTVNNGTAIVRLALKAACRFNAYCSEPIQIIEIKPAKSQAKRKSNARKKKVHK